MSAPENPQAFPMSAAEHSQGGHFEQYGMTLRDWFAGQALAALPHIGCGADLNTGDFAKAAYQIADAMLLARKGGEA